MGTRRFKLEAGDTYIVLDIDTDKIPESMASQINKFWTESDSVLDASDGDVFQAVARRAAGELLCKLINGHGKRYATQDLLDTEGWPGAENGGITIVDYDVPVFDPVDFDVEAVSQ